MPALLQRLTKLEAIASERRSAHRRVVRCIVRKDREAGDRAEAYRDAGIDACDRDLVILRVLVSARPDDRMEDLHPSATVISAA